MFFLMMLIVAMGALLVGAVKVGVWIRRRRQTLGFRQRIRDAAHKHNQRAQMEQAARDFDAMITQADVDLLNKPPEMRTPVTGFTVVQKKPVLKLVPHHHCDDDDCVANSRAPKTDASVITLLSAGSLDLTDAPTTYQEPSSSFGGGDSGSSGSWDSGSSSDGGSSSDD